MFKFYQGSLFYMSRNGDLEKFNQYSVSSEEKSLWACELFEEYKIKLCNLTDGEEKVCVLRSIFFLMKNYKIKISVDEIEMFYLKNQKNGDTFSKLIINEIFIEYINEFDDKKKMGNFIKENLEKLKKEQYTCLKEYFYGYPELEENPQKIIKKRIETATIAMEREMKWWKIF